MLRIGLDNLSSQLKTSIKLAFGILGLIATIMTIVGFSLTEFTESTLLSVLVVIIVYVLIAWLIYWIIGKIYKDSISITIRQTPVTISVGDIWKAEGWKVIGCDTHFDTRVDDVIIAKKSLHGQLVLNHGMKEEIEDAVKKEARRLGLTKKRDGLYDFPLGTIIPYHSSVDNQTYLMLALTELNEKHEAHTNMAKFEQMLMKMWAEISRVYASNDVVLPILGTGIVRFDDGPKDKDTLLKCMLCTFNGCSISLNATVKVVIYGKAEDFQLYEYKDLFKFLPRRHG